MIKRKEALQSMSIYHILVKEYTDYNQHTPSLFDIINFYYNSVSYRTLVTIRIMKYYSERNQNLCATHFKNKLVIKYGFEIGLDTKIGNHIMIPHPTGIVIGKGCIIGDECKIYQNVTIGRKNSGYPTIGHNVTIYPGAIVIGRIKIGNNVIIGANAVVVSDLPDNAVAVGIPAEVLRIENTSNSL